MPGRPIREKNPLGFSDGLVIAVVKGRVGMSKGVDLHVGNLKTGLDGHGRANQTSRTRCKWRSQDHERVQHAFL